MILVCPLFSRDSMVFICLSHSFFYSYSILFLLNTATQQQPSHTISFTFSLRCVCLYFILKCCINIWTAFWVPKDMRYTCLYKMDEYMRSSAECRTFIDLRDRQIAWTVCVIGNFLRSVRASIWGFDGVFCVAVFHHCYYYLSLFSSNELKSLKSNCEHSNMREYLPLFHK